MESTLKYLLYATAIEVLVTVLNVVIGGVAFVLGVSGPVEATVDNKSRIFAMF